MKTALVSIVIGLMVSVNAMAQCQLKLMKNSKSRFDSSGNAYKFVLNEKNPATTSGVEQTNNKRTY